MRLYIAGLYASHFNLQGNLFRKTPTNAQLLRLNIQHKLESYHYIKKGTYVERIRRDGEKVFLDSGAFSAFSLGVEVNVQEYAAFIRDHQDIIKMASVLDAIGDYNETWRNQNRLEKLGCDVLPCFHYGEPFEVGRYYAENYPYITVGGMVPVPNDKLEPWLDEVWDQVLTDKDGFAKTKVHGFGLTVRHLMEKYPWYSVDSSSWVQAAANGSIVFPEMAKTIPISARSPQIKNLGQHYDTMPESSKREIERLLHYYGLTVDDVRDNYRPRWALNAFAYDMLGRKLGDDHWKKPFRASRQTLF